MLDLEKLRTLGEHQFAPPPTLRQLEHRAKRRRAITHVAVLATGMAVLAGSLSLLGSQRRGDDGVRVTATLPMSLEDVPEGVSPIVERGTGLFLVRSDESVTAFVARSTVDPGEQLWWCPTERWFVGLAHGAVWDVNGVALGGPAPRDLDRATVSTHNGFVAIDPTIISRGALVPQPHPATVSLPQTPWASFGFCRDHVASPSRPGSDTRLGTVDSGPAVVASGRTERYTWSLAVGQTATGVCAAIVGGQAVCEQPGDSKHAIIGMLAGEVIVEPTPHAREHIAFGLVSRKVARVDVLVNGEQWRSIAPLPTPRSVSRAAWHVFLPSDIPYIEVDLIALDEAGTRLGTLTSDGPDKPIVRRR